MPERITPKLPNQHGLVRRGEADIWLSTSGPDGVEDISVTLDHGAFVALWGAAEAGAGKMLGSAGQKAFERARDSMRAAFWRAHPGLLEVIRKEQAPKLPAKSKKTARKS